MAPLMRQEVRAEMSEVGIPGVRSAVSRIADRLVAAVPPPLRPGAGQSPTIEVMVIRSSQINAFTLPGGLICVDTSASREGGAAAPTRGGLATAPARAAKGLTAGSRD